MADELTTPQTTCTEQSPRTTPGPRDARKLIWFVVPSSDFVGGGLMSICRFYAETETLLGSLGVTVVASTYPSAPTIRKYTRFENSMEIFPFAEIITHFTCLEHIILHIPEYFCKNFVRCLSPSDRLFLDTIPRLHINIMLQNIDQCEPGDIVPLRTLTDEITCTTAHEKYSTLEQSTRFGIPLHKLSVFVNHFEQHRWAEKQDIIILSPDQHPLRDHVINTIAKGLPHLELVTIADMSYESYVLLIAKAKWSLTFGEGLDYFFCEMAHTGGIPFAVYNDRFFILEFRYLPTVYESWDELQVSIVNDILYLDRDDVYQATGKLIRKALNNSYNNERYRRNIQLFYDEHYTFPGTSPARLRRDDEMLARARRAFPPIKQKERALEESIAARDANIGQLGQAIASRDADIAQLRQAIASRDADIAQLRQAIATRDANIAQLGQAITVRDADIAQFRDAMDARDANMAQLSKRFDALNTSVGQMRGTIMARDASIDALQAELFTFKQSTSWRLMSPLRSTVQLFRSGITAVKNLSRRIGEKRRMSE